MNFRAKRIIANLLSGILVSIIIPLIFATIFLLVINFVYIETPVVGFSMLPTYNMTVTDPNEYGDVVYINRVRKLERNTIVVANVSWHPDPIIKRLVGLPGDKIEIKDENNVYNLYVNDELIITKEKTDFSIDGRVGVTNVYYEQYLYYIKHNNSDKNYIELSKDEYFLMGDNWGRTTDCLTNGPIKKQEVLGTVDFCEKYKTNDKWFLLKGVVKKILKIN